MVITEPILRVCRARKIASTKPWTKIRWHSEGVSCSQKTDLAADLDPHSMHTLRGCLVERATASDPHGEALQFERQGYFSHDDNSRPERLIFNRTASLRESPGKPPTARLDLLRGRRTQSRSSSIPRS